MTEKQLSYQLQLSSASRENGVSCQHYCSILVLATNL